MHWRQLAQLGMRRDTALGGLIPTRLQGPEGPRLYVPCGIQVAVRHETASLADEEPLCLQPLRPDDAT